MAKGKYRIKTREIKAIEKKIRDTNSRPVKKTW